uniref:Uncharacterized protein n=1 Tax=Arundo donax TaxID=35708 RepID=A0A0A9D9U4_ARUDO
MRLCLSLVNRSVSLSFKILIDLLSETSYHFLVPSYPQAVHFP